MLMAVMMLTPSVSVAANNSGEKPSAGAMVADAVVARPLLLATTVLGAGLYVVTLPFTLGGGNAGAAGKALVLGPGESTFVRCLGCRKPGYKTK
ncbi:MAG: hypothetical protein V7745_03300 [Pseudomonadales bacterium]